MLPRARRLTKYEHLELHRTRAQKSSDAQYKIRDVLGRFLSVGWNYNDHSAATAQVTQ